MLHLNFQIAVLSNSFCFWIFYVLSYNQIYDSDHFCSHLLTVVHKPYYTFCAWST